MTYVRNGNPADGGGAEVESGRESNVRSSSRSPNELGLGAIGFWITFALVIIVILTSLILYGIANHALGNVVAVGLVVSAGSLASSGAVGFLFALPRSGVIATTLAAGNASDSTVRPNINLEEVSDWLTKIIVALTLTQLGDIPPVAGRLFALIGQAMNGGATSATFAGALVVFSAAMGFTLMWLLTRVYIARLMEASSYPLLVRVGR